jgi:N-acetylmuramoyl-L-alanine amidase
MQSKRESIKRLISKKHKVSCHYLIDRQGYITRMLEDNQIAWHAGKSKWKNLINLNNNSIGIELVNKGHKLGYQKFTEKQISSLIKLCLKLKKKYKIKKSRILGHSDIAPLRKIDPGEKFPWKILSKKGLAIWYLKLKKNLNPNINGSRNLFFKNLQKIGYRYINKKKRTKKDKLIIKNFQRRFSPDNVSGILDQKTYEISHFLAVRNKN